MTRMSSLLSSRSSYLAAATSRVSGRAHCCKGYVVSCNSCGVCCHPTYSGRLSKPFHSVYMCGRIVGRAHTRSPQRRFFIHILRTILRCNPSGTGLPTVIGRRHFPPTTVLAAAVPLLCCFQVNMVSFYKKVPASFSLEINTNRHLPLTHECGVKGPKSRSGYTCLARLFPPAVLALLPLSRRVQRYFPLTDRDVEFFVSP